MAAVVAPIGVQDAELSLRRVPAFPAEVVHHFAEVVRIHSQAVALAERSQGFFLHPNKARQVFQGLDIGLLGQRKDAQVFAAALYRVNEVMGHALQLFGGNLLPKDQQAGALDLDVGLGVYQMYAVHGRRGSLVKLTGQILHGQEFLSHGGGVADLVGHRFSKNAVPALLQQLVGEAKEVVNIVKAE